MTLSELREKVTDSRIRFFETSGMCYAAVVEENGDEFSLTQNEDLNELYDELRSMGLAE